LDPEQANYLPTGFSAFDDENCGIGFGNLFTIGGTSGGGKSTVAMQLAVNWMNMGEDVTMVPLEMSEDEMTARLMANAAGLDVRKILFRRLSKGERVKYIKAYKKFVRRAKTAGGSFRLFKPKQDMTIEEIMASIYPFGSRVVIIDYISLLKGVDGDDAWQKLGAVARYCKVFAENNNMIVVLLCQVNEEGKIRYAQAIKEHSSYCWVFVANQATRENEILNVEQLKARNGRFFDFTLKTEMAFMRVRDMDTGEREKLQSKMNTSKKGKSSGVPSDKSKSETAAANPTPSYLKDLAEEV
jgi:predicted ATP-dependent serine protease